MAMPMGHDLIRAHPADGLPSKRDHARDRILQHAGDGPHERRLARAVGADNGDGLAFVQGDIDAEQRLEIAVEGVSPWVSERSYLDPQVDLAGRRLESMIRRARRSR
jgi:hypothetical protein